MFFKLRNIIEDTKLFILFESGVFGDSIANRKLGFTDKDIQVTLIPKIYYVKSESAFNAFSENGRLTIAYSKTPLKDNQLQACDLKCAHLVKSIRLPEYHNQGPCYVKGTTLHNKALKVHESELKEAIFTKGTFKIRFTIWGDMSRIENPKILRLFIPVKIFYTCMISSNPKVATTIIFSYYGMKSCLSKPCISWIRKKRYSKNFI